MMDIGQAVKEMWNGRRVRRAGWNGKDMWLKIVQPGDYAYTRSYPLDQETMDRLTAFVGMRTTQGDFVPWLCSQTDLLAIDWELAD